MSKNNKDHCDYHIRSWCLDSAVDINKKGTSAKKVVKDAAVFYGFLFPKNGNVSTIKKLKNSKE